MPDHLLLPHQNRVPDDFSLHRENIVLSHYQLYAVEKYILQRTPFRQLLVVYTGDPAHTVTFDSFTPTNQAAWATTVATLRADGAKPKATTHGVILVTSLAHFRSDYNIIKIPTGNFLSVRDQLYSNVDLLRMGCFGRTALTLEDPSDVTKDRFLSTFHLPENTITPAPNPASVEHLPATSPTRPGVSRRNTGVSNNSTTSLAQRSSRDTREKVMIGKTKDPAAFVPTVLELIKVIQAGLTVFGLFPDDDDSVQAGIQLDGLLCDNTVKGINKWISRIGGPCFGLEVNAFAPTWCSVASHYARYIANRKNCRPKFRCGIDQCGSGCPKSASIHGLFVCECFWRSVDASLFDRVNSSIFPETPFFIHMRLLARSIRTFRVLRLRLLLQPSLSFLDLHIIITPSYLPLIPYSPRPP